MGVISRKIFPACANTFVCCPALRSRSRRPVKRYKKLLAEIFRKSSDGSPNEKKITKLCAYAAKNPFQIPKIAKSLEDRCYKELRSNHIQMVIVITEAYKKLLSTCIDHMACFAMNLLNVCGALLDDSKRNTVQLIGCQTLTRFIYSQVDGTYTYDLEKFVKKVCNLAHKTDEANENTHLRAESLQCLSSMVWFMMQFSHIFLYFDEIVQVTLSNYEPDTFNEVHHDCVNEVVRCEGRGDNAITVRPRKQKKIPSLLTREEIEMPKIWAQICIQRMVEMAMETTTMRRILDPMFVYFDSNQQWAPFYGLGFVVLSDMAYFFDNSGNQQLILSSLVHHLDHNNVSNNPEVKSYIIQNVTAMARQIRSEVRLTDIGYISDLFRHLRNCLQPTLGSLQEQLNLNSSLQSSIEDCLLEIVRGIANVQPLFDKMTMILEKLPPGGVVARAITGSMIILAHIISIASISSISNQVFPEGLLFQLMKLMVHPDVEIRSSGHHIFSILLIQNSKKHDASNNTRCTSTSSLASLLDNLQIQNNETKSQNHEFYTPARFTKNTEAGVTFSHTDQEACVMKFNEDQIMQLMSVFWIQANLPDNTLSNIEALSYSFSLTLLTLRNMTPDENLMVCIFQIPLSLWKISLDSSQGMLCGAHRRSLVTLSTAMLMFAAKMYKIPDIADILDPMLKSNVDSYLGISDSLQVYVKPEAELKEYSSGHDNEMASFFLVELHSKMHESYGVIVDILVQKLSNITQAEEDELCVKLLETFMPDDAIFGPQSILHSKDSHSLGTDFPRHSLVEDDAISEFSPTRRNSTSHVISIRHLLESALEVAGQVAGTSISTSPLPFGAMAARCEALSDHSRNKISTCLSHVETNFKKGDDVAVFGGETMAIKLPCANAFDNFLKASRYISI